MMSPSFTHWSAQSKQQSHHTSSLGSALLIVYKLDDCGHSKQHPSTSLGTQKSWLQSSEVCSPVVYAAFEYKPCNKILEVLLHMRHGCSWWRKRFVYDDVEDL